MRHRTAQLLIEETPTRTAPARARNYVLGKPATPPPAPAPAPARREPSTVGDIGEIALPTISDMNFMDTVMQRGPDDPHVDIVVMYRRRCGHCKPEIKRVYQYTLTHPDTSAYAVEVDADSNIDWLKSQLLGPEEGTPSTGYWAHGKLQLSSPSRAKPVEHWVKIAREGSRS